MKRVGFLLLIPFLSLALMGATTIIHGPIAPQAAGGSTQLATANFNTDAFPIASPWTIVHGAGNNALSATGGVVRPDVLDADVDYRYSGSAASITWTQDQYSEGKVTVNDTQAGNGSGMCLDVRVSTSADTYYRACFNHGATNNIEWNKRVAGSNSSLGFQQQSFSDGATIRVTATGSSTTTLSVYINGSLVSGSKTDSSSPITSGEPGIGYSSTSTSGSIDDWAAGSIP